MIFLLMTGWWHIDHRIQNQRGSQSHSWGRRYLAVTHIARKIACHRGFQIHTFCIPWQNHLFDLLVRYIKLRIPRVRGCGKIISMNIKGLKITDFTVTFKTAEVRDLAWVMSSPGLIEASAGNADIVSDEWCQKTYLAHLGELRALDENPEPLLDYLSELKSHRLGFYFETLLAFWLEYILRSAPFRKNVPVFRSIENAGRTTLGEFDFLFGQKNLSTLNHWEVTVKFYLLHESAGSELRWLGPAGRDRLDIKLARIFEHQLKLGETVEGRQEVAQISSLAIDAAAFIKGYLFYPVESAVFTSNLGDNLKFSSSAELSPAHLRGWWLRYGEKDIPKRSANSRWLPLPKSRWLSAARCSGEALGQLLDDTAALDYCSCQFEERDSSILFAEMQPGNDGWFEVARGFVVAPCWPSIDG